MKKSILVMALAMMFAVVQGYAQRSVSSGSRTTSATRSTNVSATRTATPVRSSSVSTTRTATQVRSSSVTPVRTTTSVSRSSAPVTTSSRPAVSQTRTTTSSRPVVTSTSTSRSSTTVTPTRTTSTTSRSGSGTVTRTATTSRSNMGSPSRSYSGRTQPTPHAPQNNGHHSPPPPKPRHGGGHHAPYFRHSHNYHHHHCTFEAWAWVAFLDYQYRFVRHSYYADRFFDTMLGCYLYGSLRTPNKILVGNTLLHRYSDYISVRCNNKVDCYYVYTDTHVMYHVGNNTVDLLVGGGYVTVTIYDNYGNESTYYL